jgi:hypothetical protein
MSVEPSGMYRIAYHLAFWITAGRLWIGHRIPFFSAKSYER